MGNGCRNGKTSVKLKINEIVEASLPLLFTYLGFQNVLKEQQLFATSSLLQFQSFSNDKEESICTFVLQLGHKCSQRRKKNERDK